MTKRRKSRRRTTVSTTKFARSLRRESTPAERLPWSRLRRNNLGHYFRRQAPAGRFVLDFYCSKSGLAIEVDGDVHAGNNQHDLMRSRWLENNMHIQVLRVSNQDVLENIEGVIHYILQYLESSPAPPPLPSPVKKTT